MGERQIQHNKFAQTYELSSKEANMQDTPRRTMRVNMTGYWHKRLTFTYATAQRACHWIRQTAAAESLTYAQVFFLFHLFAFLASLLSVHPALQSMFRISLFGLWSVFIICAHGCVVFSEREICYRPSVCSLSVTFLCPTQPVKIFGDVSKPFGTLAILWPPGKILRRSSKGNPSSRGLNARGVAEYNDFGPIEDYISERCKIGSKYYY